MKILQWDELVGESEAFHTVRYSYSGPSSEHSHNFAEVFWVSKGQATHRINGEALPLQAGSLCWIRPPDFHGIETASDEPITFTNIAFGRETMDFLGERYFAGRAWALWETGKQPATQQLELYQIQLLERWADELARSPRQRFYIERFLLNLLGELNPQREAEWSAEAPNWLTHACREIQKPEHFVGGVSAFVALTGYSREHASRCLRQFAQTTPTEIVNRARMVHAAHQLEMSDKGILDIALSCGLDNLSHFYKLFQAQFGVTPRTYRLTHRKMF